jgi:transcriptional regulator with XRE-family HTH domain
MGLTPEPNYYGRQLIRELKKLRQLARLTQHDVCERAHIEPKKFSRLENRQIPNYHELCMLLDVYGLLSSDWSPYLELWDQAKRPAWWSKYDLADTRYLRMEDVALTKYEFRLGYLPELLQTEDYARAVFTRTADHRSSLAVSDLVEVRLRRQERVLNGELSLYALIHEPVLRQGVDQPQLAQLVARAELPNVTLQIVPLDKGLHDGLHSSVTVLSFPDPKEPDIAFADTLAGLAETQEPHQVAKIKRAIDRISSLALSPRNSLARLQEMIGQPAENH